MTVRPVLVIAAGLLVGQAATLRAEGDAAAAPLPALSAIIEEQQATAESVEAEAATKEEALAQRYGEELDGLRKQAISEGNLDHVLAVDSERPRAVRDLTEEERASLFYALKECRYHFDRSRRELAESFRSRRAAFVRGQAIKLESLEAALCRLQDSEGAAAVRYQRFVLFGLVSPLDPIPKFKPLETFETLGKLRPFATLQPLAPFKPFGKLPTASVFTPWGTATPLNKLVKNGFLWSGYLTPFCARPIFASSMSAPARAPGAPASTVRKSTAAGGKGPSASGGGPVPVIRPVSLPR